MQASSKLDFSQSDYRSLPPEPQQVLAAGRSAIRNLATDLLAALVRWRRAHAERRQRRRAMVQLGAFSDLELKDIGVYRSEIQWVVSHGRRVNARGRAA